MPRRRALRAAAAAGGAAGLAVTAGCVPGVLDLPDPDASPAEAVICRDLLAALPERVDGADLRRTNPGRLTRAWGDPPITLTCGGPPPSADDGDGRCFEVDGVGWKATPGRGGTLFTTWQRRATVQVGVPESDRPPGNALLDLAGPIAAHDPATAPCL